MAQRFYFDLTDGLTTIRDDEGVEADDLTDALKQAEAALEEMSANGELADFDPGWRLVIRTGTETVLVTIPIA
ncbi:DUF6894 family protein [Methylobacterium nodulans]|uniref:DUF6894 family protein n=1 Tax=Methylobacterium nodulans TaxID=114616 RepID=UPI00031DFF62|nr:hypothetical protein [Methylobacterium nodulans]